MTNITPELIQYVKDERMKGVSDEALSQTLLHNGWDEATVQESLAQNATQNSISSKLPGIWSLFKESIRVFQQNFVAIFITQSILPAIIVIATAVQAIQKGSGFNLTNLSLLTYTSFLQVPLTAGVIGFIISRRGTPQKVQSILFDAVKHIPINLINLLLLFIVLFPFLIALIFGIRFFPLSLMGGPGFFLLGLASLIIVPIILLAFCMVIPASAIDHAKAYKALAMSQFIVRRKKLSILSRVLVLYVVPMFLFELLISVLLRNLFIEQIMQATKSYDASILTENPSYILLGVILPFVFQNYFMGPLGTIMLCLLYVQLKSISGSINISISKSQIILYTLLVLLGVVSIIAMIFISLISAQIFSTIGL